MSTTTLVGTLLEIHDGFIVLTGPTYIMLPPGMKVENLPRRGPPGHGDLATWALDRSAHRACPSVMKESDR